MKRIGMGYENFKRMIDDDCYYVDKTLIIKDLIEKKAMVTLFTRPRRFGKTLALSTIRTFFELEYDRDGKIVDKLPYFEGLKIMDAGDDIVSKMGQYPVIFLTLKSAKQNSFSNAFYQLKSSIIDEISRHSYLLNSDRLDEGDKAKIKELLGSSPAPYRADHEGEIRLAADVSLFAKALGVLSGLLSKHHGKNVIILLDEYDVPLENAYQLGFYDEMVGFIRSLFESALKTNDALEFAVVTGCLRISKESIFTGLNNLKVNSILEGDFTESFGFTQAETEKMLVDFGLDSYIEEVKEWYDGYLFGKSEIYNPWSVISYVDGKVNGQQEYPKPYWSNTSSNSIIKELIYGVGENIKRELNDLISGGIIEKCIHEDITYGDIHESEDNLWNFLFFTGYLKKVSERFENNHILISMKIPNLEIKNVYEDQIQNWFNKEIRDKTDREVLYSAIRQRDTERINAFLENLLKQSISTFDSYEGFYHGFLLSLLLGMADYEPKSNREEGNGRPDIVLYPENAKEPAYIFEIKARKKFNEMNDGLEEALSQIRDQKYEEGILDDGYAGVVSFGICFCKKSCVVGIKE